jgi:stage II sporulation protein D
MAVIQAIVSSSSRKLRLLLALAIASGLLIPATAHADVTFNLYGSGNGHGIGLPQWGAYGLAAKGWTAPQILTHFFTGTTVGLAPSTPSKVRVGLLQDRAGINIKAINQGTSLRLGSTSGTQIALIPVGETWTVQIKSGTYWIKKTDGTYVGNKGYGDSTTSLFAAYSGTGGSVYLSQAGHTYARGYMEMNIYSPCSGCALRLRAIQILVPQAYLFGVAESPVDWGSTAQKTQAITSRGYAFWLIETYGQHRAGCNCGVWSSTRDQYYVGSDRELASSGAAWIAAVKATDGKVVLYNGAVAQANFSSASGGYTEDSENVWGGTAFPYLRGVCDRGDYNAANPNRTWLVSMTGSTMGAKIKAYKGVDIGAVTGFSGISRGVSSRLRTITVVGSLGSVTLTGLGFRAALGLKDDKVWINTNRNITGQIRLAYDAANCRPGPAGGAQKAVTGGSVQLFADGRIYRNAALGKAFWLHGLVVDRYVELGQWASSLGMPTSGIQNVDADHQKASFDNGTITCTISTSTCT